MYDVIEECENVSEMYFNMMHEEPKKLSDSIRDNDEIRLVNYHINDSYELVNYIGTIFRSKIFNGVYLYNRLSEFGKGSGSIFIVDYNNKIILNNSDYKIKKDSFSDLIEKDKFKYYESSSIYGKANEILNDAIFKELDNMCTKDPYKYFSIRDYTKRGRSKNYTELNIGKDLILGMYDIYDHIDLENFDIENNFCKYDKYVSPKDVKIKYHNLYTLYLILLNYNQIYSYKDYIIKEINNVIEDKPADVSLVRRYIYDFVNIKESKMIYRIRKECGKFDYEELNILENIVKSIADYTQYKKTKDDYIKIKITTRTNEKEMNLLADNKSNFEYHLADAIFIKDNEEIDLGYIDIKDIIKITHRNKILYKK